MSKKHQKSEDYIELLKSPEWQKKRLEIFQRDEFRCWHCLHTDKPLSVHHFYYEFGRKPWEYENESLLTLCEDCHKETQEAEKRLRRQIGLFLKNGFKRTAHNLCNLLNKHSKDILKLVDGEGSSEEYINNNEPLWSNKELLSVLYCRPHDTSDIIKKLADIMWEDTMFLQERHAKWYTRAQELEEIIKNAK